MKYYIWSENLADQNGWVVSSEDEDGVDNPLSGFYPMDLDKVLSILHSHGVQDDDIQVDD